MNWGFGIGKESLDAKKKNKRTKNDDKKRILEVAEMKTVKTRRSR